MKVPSRIPLAGLLLLFGLSSALRALDGSETFTLDLPFGTNEATPAWLGHPVTPPTTFATLDLPITPPDAGASLLVTVFFQEQDSGFLRVSWQATATPGDSAGTLPGPGEAAQSSVLCDNFYEGIGMSNQRSLLVSAYTMKQPGTLQFQCGAGTLGISRIRLEWLQTSTGLSSPAITDLLVTPANGKTQLAADLSGLPATAQDPAWHGRIVNVPVTDVPLRIEQGVDFTVQMDGAPTQARIALKESGLPWGQHLVVWLNGRRAGVIMPAVPELGDAGYPDDHGGTYVGWREGTFYAPGALFVAGNDKLQFSAEPDVPTAAPTDPNAAPVPLAVKDVDLQLDYPNAADSTASAVAAPAPTSVPTAVTNALAAVAPSSASVGMAAAATSAPAPASSDDASMPAPNAQNPALLSLPVNASSTPDPVTP